MDKKGLRSYRANSPRLVGDSWSKDFLHLKWKEGGTQGTNRELMSRSQSLTKMLYVDRTA